jgi:hypothetical protein
MEGVKGFFVAGLAAIGIYAIFEWYVRGKAATNPVATEVAGIAQSNVTASNQMTSGIPTFNPTPIANGHGDQVSAAYHSNRFSTVNGSPNYEPAFGPSANQ